MLTMLGSPRRCRDGLTRRETLRAGALTALGGLSLTDLLNAAAAARTSVPRGKAKSVMLLYLLGGAATQDMWDLKPDAPKEVRGEFKPIATSLPGVQFSEHLPKLARHMHRCTLVRSVHHSVNNSHAAAVYVGLTGHEEDAQPGQCHDDRHDHHHFDERERRPTPGARRVLQRVPNAHDAPPREKRVYPNSTQERD